MVILWLCMILYDPSGGQAISLTVIGHAFGNRAARMVEHRYPGRVDKVILPAAGGQKPIDPKANQALKDGFDPFKTLSQREQAIRYAFFADGNPIPDYWLRGWHYKTALMQENAIRLTTDSSWQQAGGNSMLILQPAQDKIAPIQDAGRVLKEQLGGRVKLVIIGDAGHALLPEQPDLVAREILAFFTTEP